LVFTKINGDKTIISGKTNNLTLNVGNIVPFEINCELLIILTFKWKFINEMKNKNSSLKTFDKRNRR
jgi:hypothetical protein